MHVHRTIASVVTLSIACVLPSHAFAQYTAQVLLPPPDMPSGAGTITRALAINNRGDVFGEAGNGAVGFAPVLWTNGIPIRLPIPTGYYWRNATGEHFLNDDGTVVSAVGIPNGIPPVRHDEFRVIVWKNGIPSIAPVPPVLCEDSRVRGFAFPEPLGMNRAGHVLMYGVCDDVSFWVWDGANGLQPVALPDLGAQYGPDIVANQNHLGGADQVSIGRYRQGQFPTVADTGIVVGNTYLALAPGRALAINEPGHVLAYDPFINNACPSFSLWNGAALVDLGLARSAVLNDAGQVLIAGAGCMDPTGGPARTQLYENGALTDLVINPETTGLTSFNVSAPFLFNVRGQSVVQVTPADPYASYVERVALLTPATPAPPTLTLPANIVAEASSRFGAAVTYSASAVAIDGTPALVTCAPASGSTFPLGTTTVACTATDRAGSVSTGAFRITIVDTTPPVLTLPGNMTAEATAPAGATVTFSVSAVDLVAGTVPVNCLPASGATLPLGVTPVLCSASDSRGNTATAGFTVTIVDTTPPAITSLTPSLAVLWPPNHKLVTVTVAAQATDLVDGPVSACTIASATSSEPDNGLGDGDTTGDVVLKGGLTVNLRAERSGAGSGRTYTINVTCVDRAGNRSAPRPALVVVPKSQ